MKKTLALVLVVLTVPTFLMASSSFAAKRIPAQAGTGTEIGNRGEGLEKREVSGGLANQLIKALDLNGIQSVGTAGKQTYTLPQLGCETHNNMFVDPSDPQYGKMSYACVTPKVSEQKKAKALISAVEAAGVNPEHAMGGKSFYEVFNLECVIHGPVQGAGHYTCSFEYTPVEE